jgi:hypothetical protein
MPAGALIFAPALAVAAAAFKLLLVDKVIMMGWSYRRVLKRVL